MDDIRNEASQSYENDCVNADKEKEDTKHYDHDDNVETTYERAERERDEAQEEEITAMYLTDAKMGLI